jgi:hypothetical protein
MKLLSTITRQTSGRQAESEVNTVCEGKKTGGDADINGR